MSGYWEKNCLILNFRAKYKKASAKKITKSKIQKISSFNFRFLSFYVSFNFRAKNSNMTLRKKMPKIKHFPSKINFNFRTFRAKIQRFFCSFSDTVRNKMFFSRSIFHYFFARSRKICKK